MQNIPCQIRGGFWENLTGYVLLVVSNSGFAVKLSPRRCLQQRFLAWASFQADEPDVGSELF
jgi:hypothetical protein